MPDSTSLPHARDAEESVLGAILIDSDRFFEIAPFVQADDFYLVRHQWIWDVFSSLSEKQTPIDYLTVAQELAQRNQLEELGGPAYLMTLINQTPSSLNAASYAQIVAEFGLRRRILNAANQVAQLAYQHQLPIEKVLASAERVLLQTTQRRAVQTLSSLAEIVSAIYDQLQAALQAPQALPGLPSGFKDLDQLLQGLQAGNLLVLAGRPGMGKTSFALSLVLNLVQKTMKRAVIFSLEMSRMEVGQRLLAQASGIDGQRLRSGRLQAQEWPLFISAVEALARLPVLVDDSPSLTPMLLRSRCRQLQEQGGLDLVVIDYLQLLSGGQSLENRQAEVSAISRQLKALAKELNVPVLAAAQLSRAVEQRGEKRPILSDLRDSGSIEQDSDIVMFLFKDEMKPGHMILEVAKHRNGPTGIVSLAFHARQTRFENATR